MQLSPGENDKLTIVGIVKGIKIPGATDIPMRIYVPNSPTRTSMMIKLIEGQQLDREEFARVIGEVDKMFAVYSFDFVSEQRTKLLFPQITTAVTTAILALLSFALAGIGLYGVLSYGTQMRRFELGTRMAIGAEPGDLIKLIIKDNSIPILIGILASGILLISLYLSYASELVDYVNLKVIINYLVTLVAISALSFVACYLPLRKFINKPAIYCLRGEGS